MIWRNVVYPDLDSNGSSIVSTQCNRVAVDGSEWRTGYYKDACWDKAPPEKGKVNRLMSRYDAQIAFDLPADHDQPTVWERNIMRKQRSLQLRKARQLLLSTAALQRIQDAIAVSDCGSSSDSDTSSC